MSEEKRQTRLLPFRLRRAGARRHTPTKFAGYFSEFADDSTEFSTDDPSADAELSTALRVWDAPELSTRARERLLVDFRVAVRPAPLWRRALAVELRVPLPMAACAVVALVLSFSALAARAFTRDTPAKTDASVHSKADDAKAFEPSNMSKEAAVASKEAAPASESATASKVVEVPVPVERIVTRVVYVEKKERGETLPMPARVDGRHAVSVEATWPKAASADEDARVRDLKGAGATTSYFTHVDMNDFQPADEVKIRIVKRGRADEK